MTLMPFSRPILDIDTQIDFYAGSEAAMDNLLPVWEALPDVRKGTFYSWSSSYGKTQVETFENDLPGSNPLVITNPADLSTVFYAGEERAFILIEFEHHKQTRGLLSTVSLFLCATDKDATVRKAFSEKYQQVVLFTDPASIVNQITKFIVGVAPKHRDKIGKDTLGIVYMAWGEKAATAVKRSVATLKRIGYSYPVCVVGPEKVDGFQFIEWKGESPFDSTQKKNFQFRAGRIKPFLYGLSPFDRTLYIDADTEFVQDIHAGFEMLSDYDIALTQEYLTVGELYNKFMAGWEINIEERAQTIKEGVPAEQAFINSGVIFFRKSKNNQKLFKEWHTQWMRFQQWDEQLALMRALALSKSSRKYLTPAWNDPQPHEDTIIFHDYGHGHVRMNP
jgi:hypothetical protein